MTRKYDSYIPLASIAESTTELQFTILNGMTNETFGWNQLAVDAEWNIYIVIVGFNYSQVYYYSLDKSSIFE